MESVKIISKSQIIADSFRDEFEKDVNMRLNDIGCKTNYNSYDIMVMNGQI